MGRLYLFLLLLPFLLPAGGCCYLADWMGCYPDTPLVSQGYQTPAETLETFKAALLHGQVDLIYLCLSQGLKRRLGLDSMTAHLAWPRLQEKIPFLRSLFRARVTGRTTLPDGRRELILEAAGHRLRLVLKGEGCVKVLALAAGEEGKLVVRRILDDDLPGELARALEVDRRGVLTCRLDRPEWREELQELENLEEIAHVSAGIEWKIDELVPIED